MRHLMQVCILPGVQRRDFACVMWLHNPALYALYTLVELFGCLDPYHMLSERLDYAEQPWSSHFIIFFFGQFLEPAPCVLYGQIWFPLGWTSPISTACHNNGNSRTSSCLFLSARVHLVDGCIALLITPAMESSLWGVRIKNWLKQVQLCCTFQHPSLAELQSR